MNGVSCVERVLESAEEGLSGRRREAKSTRRTRMRRRLRKMRKSKALRWGLLIVMWLKLRRPPKHQARHQVEIWIESPRLGSSDQSQSPYWSIVTYQMSTFNTQTKSEN